MNKPNMNDYMDNEPHEEPWTPGVGDKVKIACDWTMAQGQIGTVQEINPYRDADGEIDGATLIVQHEDGSRDEYEFEDLIHPDEELFLVDEYDDDIDDEEEDRAEIEDYDYYGDDV